MLIKWIQDLDRDRDLRDFFSGVLERLRLRLLLADLLLDFFLSRDRLLSRESLRSKQKVRRRQRKKVTDLIVIGNEIASSIVILTLSVIEIALVVAILNVLVISIVIDLLHPILHE